MKTGGLLLLMSAPVMILTPSFRTPNDNAIFWGICR